MTTIADYLKQTSNTLHKEAAQATPAANAQNSSPFTFFGGLVGSAAPAVYTNKDNIQNIVNTVRDATDFAPLSEDYYGNTPEENMRFLQGFNTWDRAKGYMSPFLQNEEYKEYAPYFKLMNRDPEAQKILLGNVNKTINDWYSNNQNGGYNAFRNDFNIWSGVRMPTALKQKIIENVQGAIPQIGNQLLNTSIYRGDYIPDENIGKDQGFLDYWNKNGYGQQYTEADYLDYLAFGANPAYRGISKRWYSEDPNKTNSALLGLGDTFINNRTLGLQMLNHYGSLSAEQQKEAVLSKILQQYIDLGNQFGIDSEEFNKLKDLQANLPTYIGRNGERFMPTADLYDTIQSQAKPIYDQIKAKMAEKLGDNNAITAVTGIDPYSGIDNTQRAMIAQNAVDIQNNPWASGYYGMLNNPDIRRAAQYVAPWLMYGFPMAGLASMFGNNSLWPIILLGGLGSGAFGYFGNGMFGNGVMNQADQAFGAVNSPLSHLAKMFTPEGYEAVGNTLTNVLNPPQQKQMDQRVQPISPAEYKQNPNAYSDEDGNLKPEYHLLSQNTPYTATGNVQMNNQYPNTGANYYMNQQTSSMPVASQLLS